MCWRLRKREEDDEDTAKKSRTTAYHQRKKRWMPNHEGSCLRKIKLEDEGRGRNMLKMLIRYHEETSEPYSWSKRPKHEKKCDDSIFSYERH